MNFFEQELRKLFDDGRVILNPTYTGRTCYGELCKDLRVRADFVTIGYADHYEALKLSIINRTEGVIDTALLRFRDIWGIKPVPHNPNFRNGVSPHIWKASSSMDWYAYHPTAADYAELRNGVNAYLEVFRPRENELEQTSLEDHFRSASGNTPLKTTSGKSNTLNHER